MCPLCRRLLPQEIEDFSVNIILDSLSHRIQPEKYMKILTLNNEEFRKKKILQRLIRKYDQDYKPTPYERFVRLINILFPYFKTIKILMTIFTPRKWQLQQIRII